MDNRNRTFARLLTLTLALGVAAVFVLFPADGSGQTRRGRQSEFPTYSNTDPWGGFDDFGRTILQMQRESLSSQEEQAREVGRQQRRQELEAEQQRQAAERVEYFDSLIEASRAALRAPRGVYYRRPGFLSTDLPASGAASVTVGGIPYIYDRGIFLLAQGAQYVVVTAPVGAIVEELPAGAYPVSAGAGVLHYFFGTFFRALDGKFEVAVPPPGAFVSYLPDGYTIEKANGAVRYRFGSATFKPAFLQGVLVYQVVTP